MNFRESKEEKAFFAKFDLFEAMKNRDFITDDIRTYLYRYSSVLRAIKTYIAKADEDCVLINKKDPILSTSASGPCVSYRSCHTYASDFKTDPKTHKSIEIKPTVFCLRVAVRFVDREEAEAGYENPREFEREFDIQVPIDLEKNFSQKSFDAWIKTLAEKKKAERTKIDEKELTRLIKKYPNQVALLLLKKEAANAK